MVDKLHQPPRSPLKLQQLTKFASGGEFFHNLIL